LVSALASCANSGERPKVRRFLLGLSWDELEYIAEFVGSSILESSTPRFGSRDQLAGRVTEFERTRLRERTISAALLRDHEHKMMVLMEYLCRTGPRQESLVARAGA
jgi:hypothetical protein